MQANDVSNSKTKRLFSRGLMFALALAAFVLAFLPGGLSPARAQDTESACRNDAYRLCSQYIPNEGAVKVCMRRNVRSLSAACRAGFVQQRASRGRKHVRHYRHSRKHHYRKHRRHR